MPKRSMSGIRISSGPAVFLFRHIAYSSSDLEENSFWAPYVVIFHISLGLAVLIEIALFHSAPFSRLIAFSVNATGWIAVDSGNLGGL